MFLTAYQKGTSASAIGLKRKTAKTKDAESSKRLAALIANAIVNRHA